MEEEKEDSSSIENNTPPALKVEPELSPPPIKLGMLQLIQKMTKPLRITDASIPVSNKEENSKELKSQAIASTPTVSRRNWENTNISSPSQFKKSDRTKSKGKSSKASASLS